MSERKDHKSPNMALGSGVESSQKKNRSSKGKPKANKTKSKSKLPTWITSNLRNKRSLQLWFRCWIATWAAFILMLPDRSLTNLGQAAFFTCMVLLMLPPLMTPFLWLMAISTLVIGALFGWAVGCAAMASGIKARDFLVTGAAIQKAQQSAASATNPELAFRSTIFEGRYLDTNSSVVFGVYLVVFTYFLGFITARAQKLKLFCIFATIVLDVHICYGPLFPTGNYTLATIFMLPIAYSLAIAAFCIMFIFPRTLNADWTDELAGLVHRTVDLLQVHRAYLHKAVTGQHLPEVDGDDEFTSEQEKDSESPRLASFPELSQEFEAHFRALTGALVQGSESLAGSAPFLELEPSRGLFSGKDLRKILAHVQKAGVRIFGMNAFHHLLESEHPGDEATRQQAKEQAVQPGGAKEDAKDEDIEIEEAQASHAVFHVHASLRLMHWRKHIRVAESAEHVRLREDLLPILHRGAMPALTAAQGAMQALEQWLKASNTGRWSLTSNQRKTVLDGQVQKLKALRDALRTFEDALNHFIDKERIALLKPYEGHFLTQEGEDGSHFLSQDTYKTFRHSARPVFLCLLFCANFSNFGHTSIQQIQSIIALSERRVFGLTESQQVQLKVDHGGKLDYDKLTPAGAKIWFPTGLRKLGKIILSRRSGAGGVGPGSGAVFPSEIEDNGHDEAVPVVRRRIDQDIELESGRPLATYRMHAPDADAQHRAEMEELDDEEEDDDDRADHDTIGSSVVTAPTIRETQSLAPHQGQGQDVNSPAPKPNGGPIEASKKEEQKKKRAQRAHAPDPDALPPTNAFQRFNRLLSNGYDTACSPDGIFALRYALVSFAVWIPAVIPSSAGFYYANRGLWALIMAQTGLTITSGEAVFQLAGRLGGTIIGALAGMVIWYIGAGSGRGNAIGIAAAMGVVLVPLTFFRAFVPLTLLIPCMLSAITLVLVVGYSWIDTHLAGITANSGWGKDVAWRRLLLVLIGVAAAIIVMLFPRPVSTRVQVRKGLASVTRDIQRLYCLLIEAWIISDLPEATDSVHKEHAKHTQERIDAKLVLFRTRFQMAQAKLAGLAPKIKLASIDLQPRGRWDAKSYGELLSTQARQLEALSQLAGSLHFMRPEWRHQFATNTAVLNPEVVSDISLQLSLIAASLDKGDPLPHAGIGVLYERVLLAGIFSTRVQEALSAQAQRSGSEGTPQSFFAEVLSFETLQTPDYMNVVLGAISLTTLAKQTDELANIVAKLCGELQIRGFDLLRDEQGRRSLKAFGIEGF